MPAVKEGYGVESLNALRSWFTEGNDGTEHRRALSALVFPKIGETHERPHNLGELYVQWYWPPEKRSQYGVWFFLYGDELDEARGESVPLEIASPDDKWTLDEIASRFYIDPDQPMWMRIVRLRSGERISPDGASEE